jgi:hypothetical protein
VGVIDQCQINLDRARREFKKKKQGKNKDTQKNTTKEHTFCLLPSNASTKQSPPSVIKNKTKQNKKHTPSHHIAKFGSSESNRFFLFGDEGSRHNIYFHGAPALQIVWSPPLFACPPCTENNIKAAANSVTIRRHKICAFPFISRDVQEPCKCQ